MSVRSFGALQRVLCLAFAVAFMGCIARPSEENEELPDAQQDDEQQDFEPSDQEHPENGRSPYDKSQANTTGCTIGNCCCTDPK